MTRSIFEGRARGICALRGRLATALRSTRLLVLATGMFKVCTTEIVESCVFAKLVQIEKYSDQGGAKAVCTYCGSQQESGV